MVGTRYAPLFISGLLINDVLEFSISACIELQYAYYTTHIVHISPFRYHNSFTKTVSTMPVSRDKRYIAETPEDVKNAKGLHLVTQNTPNGQAVQIFLEELAKEYDTTWTTTVINISTKQQKKEWFLRLDPNGRIPLLIDNTQDPPFPSHETSAEMLYLEKFYDKNNAFGFKDDLERSECLQWMFFWHGSGAPYQGQVNHFSRAAPEKIECL